MISTIQCLAYAFMLGLATTAIPCPISMLFINKTLEIGKRGSIAILLSVTLADLIYGAIIGFGAINLRNFLVAHQELLNSLCGGFFLYLSYNELKLHDKTHIIQARTHNSYKLFAKVFFLSITSPLTIISWISIFTFAGSAQNENMIVLCGAILGGIIWWFLLYCAMMCIKQKISNIWIQRVRYVSSVIIGIFGMFTVLAAAL